MHGGIAQHGIRQITSKMLTNSSLPVNGINQSIYSFYDTSIILQYQPFESQKQTLLLLLFSFLVVFMNLLWHACFIDYGVTCYSCRSSPFSSPPFIGGFWRNRCFSCRWFFWLGRDFLGRDSYLVMLCFGLVFLRDQVYWVYYIWCFKSGNCWTEIYLFRRGLWKWSLVLSNVLEIHYISDFDVNVSNDALEHHELLHFHR